MIIKKVHDNNFRNKVRVVKIPEGITLIDENKLKDIVRDILIGNKNEENKIPMSKSIFKSIIYDLVIDRFKKDKFYYKGLNLNIIWKQVNILSSDFEFVENNNVLEQEEKEFDELCWMKANNKEYPIKRFEFLRKKLCQ